HRPCARLTDRVLRHDALLGPHDPASAAGDGGGAAARDRGAHHARAALLVARGPSTLDPAGAALDAGPGAVGAAGGVGDPRGRHVVLPLLAPVRCRAGGRDPPSPRARALPGDRDALLVARRRCRPEPAPAQPPRPHPVPRARDAALVVPRAG